MNRGRPHGSSPIAATPGPTRADLTDAIERGLLRGDPLADRWADTGDHRALADAVRDSPAWVDHDQIELAQWTAMRLRSGFLFALKGASLMIDFWSPAMSRPLLSTGRLLDEPRRRLEATARWWTRVHLPGSLRPDGDGAQATVDVRMIHAVVRRALREDDGAVAINQTHLLVQAMGFTLLPLAAVEQMGHRITTREREAQYSLWRYVGHHLGIDAELVPFINERDLRALRDLWIAAHTPDADGRRLAAAVSTTPALAPRWLQPHDRLFRRYEHEMTRAFLGPTVADGLHLPGRGDGWMARGMTRPIVRAGELARRIDHTADDRRVRRAVRRSRDLLTRLEPADDPSTRSPGWLGGSESEVLA